MSQIMANMCLSTRSIHHIYIVICPFRLVIMYRELFCGWSIAIPAAMRAGLLWQKGGGRGKACHVAFLQRGGYRDLSGKRGGKACHRAFRQQGRRAYHRYLSGKRGKSISQAFPANLGG